MHHIGGLCAKEGYCRIFDRLEGCGRLRKFMRVSEKSVVLRGIMVIGAVLPKAMVLALHKTGRSENATV